MSEFDITFEGLDIPAQCRKCPALCELATRMLVDQVETARKQAFATNIIMNDEISGLLAPRIADLTGLPEEDVTAATDEATARMRMEVADDLNKADEQKELRIRGAQALLDTCLGALTMRAHTKLGTEIRVTVCGSNLAPLEADLEEHAHVTRKPLA